MSTSIINSVPIVIITINYRLGLFGFLADEALYGERSGINNRSTTSIYGILDQMMALDWVKKNIAGFGGNPEKITVGSESAGGISAIVLLTSPLVANGTFQRANVGSGGIWPNTMYTLQEAINKTGNVLRAMTTYPVIDGYVLNDIMENYYARGNFQKVPMLIGTTANETTTITCPIFNGATNTTQVQAFFNTLYNTIIIDEIPTIYGPISTFNNPLTYLNIVYSDSWMHCGSRRIASAFSIHGVPSYLYTYNYLLSATPSCSGAAHAAELPMLFPSYLRYFLRNYTFSASDQQLSTNMMLYWAHFIYNSNPNYRRNPANWDVYLPSSDNDFVLEINPQMRNHYYNPTCSWLWDLYAVTNSSFTSTAVRYAAEHHCFWLFYVLICIRSFLNNLIFY